MRFNQVLVEGNITNILDTNNQYIKFSIVTDKYTTSDNKNVYVSMNISREHFNKYKHYFYIGNNVFIKGYLNYYIDKNKDIKGFITATQVSDCLENLNTIFNIRKEQYIRTDPDNVEVFNGKRCEQNLVSEEVQRKFEEKIKRLRDGKE